MNTLLIIGTCLSGVATLVDIIGIAIPYWLVASFGSDNINVHGNIGLFRACVDVTEYDFKKCEAIDSESLPSWWKATQAMVLLSILAMSVGIALTLLFGFVMKDKQIIALAAAFMIFSGAMLAIIGVIIFGSKTDEIISDNVIALISANAKLDLHAGFGLVILSAILAVPASVTIFMSRKRNV